MTNCAWYMCFVCEPYATRYTMSRYVLGKPARGNSLCDNFPGHWAFGMLRF